MPNISTIIGVTLALLGIAGGGFFIWQLTSLLDELLATKQQKLFQEDLTMAVLHSKVSWQNVLQMAEIRGVKQSDIHRTLKRMLRDILTNRNLSLMRHREAVEGFLDKMKQTEPFEGLPNELRIHLERLREQLSSPAALDPLTLQIRELVSVNSRERRNQRYYTVGGFVLGIIGLVFAAYPYFAGGSAPSAAAAQESQVAHHGP